MKKIFAGLLESLHLLATALLFATTFWLAPLADPLRGWKATELASFASRFHDTSQDFLRSRGPWVAALALTFAAVAGILRGDAKKLTAMLRIVAAGAGLLFSLWAALDLPAARLPQAWNGLFTCVTFTLLLTGFLVGGKGGGGGSSSKPK